MAGTNTGFDAAAFRDATSKDAWLAGLYEGEGSISYLLNHGVPRLQLQVKMTDEDVLRTFHGLAGVGRVYGPYSRNDNRKPCWSFICYSPGDVMALCKRMCPYLHERRRSQIDTALGAYTDAKAARTPPTLSERFWGHVDRSGECWLWTGCLNWAGAGHFSLTHKTTTQAHRFAYEEAHGPLPKFANLRNTCENRRCVRHWELARGRH